MPLTNLPGHRSIARCEVHTRKAVSATRRLLPYLLVKRDQALLLLEVARIHDRTDRRSQERHRELEAIHRALLSLHDGERRGSEPFRQNGHPLRGTKTSGPTSWAGREIKSALTWQESWTAMAAFALRKEEWSGCYIPTTVSVSGVRRWHHRQQSNFSQERLEAVLASGTTAGRTPGTLLSGACTTDLLCRQLGACSPT